MPKKLGVQTACCIHGYYAAVEELLVCKENRKPHNVAVKTDDL